MAGGTALVTALGGALGGVLGAGTAHEYVEEDKSFRIAKLRSGDGVPVVVRNGFLTEGGIGWGEWEDIVATRYPDSPVYRVHWGAKELKDLAVFAGGGPAKVAVPVFVKRAAAKAAKAGAKRLDGLAPALNAAGLLHDRVTAVSHAA